MVDQINQTKLQQCAGEIVALERQMEKALEEWSVLVGGHADASQVVRGLGDTVRTQRAALEERLQAIGGQLPGSPETIMALPIAGPPGGSGGSDAAFQGLHAIHTACAHLAFAYAGLHALAHRFYDSSGEGNTADLAEAHLRGYAAAAQEINQLASEVVVWGLTEQGQQCRCRCPSCGLGVCLCSPHGTVTVNQSWQQTSPAALAEPGVVVRRPRAGSPAALAGLAAGDRVLSVDGQEIASDLDVSSIQAAIRKHQSGEEVCLRVRGRSGEIREVTVIRP